MPVTTARPNHVVNLRRVVVLKAGAYLSDVTAKGGATGVIWWRR